MPSIRSEESAKECCAMRIHRFGGFRARLALSIAGLLVSSFACATADSVTPAAPDSVIVEGLTRIIKGDTVMLTAVARAQGAWTPAKIAWSSSNPDIASVRQDGVVVGMARGTATITARAVDAIGLATITIVGVSGLTVTPNSATVAAGLTRMLQAQVVADSGVGFSVAWRSSDPRVATVSTDGVVTAVSPGIVTITATARDATGNSVITVPSIPPLGVGFGDEQFAAVPSGSFRMGSDFRQGDFPVRNVTLTKAFQMQRTEVTQAQWTEIMEFNSSRFRACGYDCPMEGMSWQAVQTFLSRLNAKYPGKGFRLPTEAEWEYAARAGTTGDFGGTGIMSDMGWSSENSNGGPKPVALKRPNAWSLYDMHGNAWEWVADWIGTDFTVADTIDPIGPSTGTRKVLRGGSWSRPAVDARSAARFSLTPTSGNEALGFRMARDP